MGSYMGAHASIGTNTSVDTNTSMDINTSIGTNTSVDMGASPVETVPGFSLLSVSLSTEVWVNVGDEKTVWPLAA